MIIELAEQSIQTKIKLKSSTMLGNYEFYYASGLLCRKLNLTVEQGIKPAELYELIKTNTEGKTYEDDKVAHLVKMIHLYKPEEAYDEQMQELFQKGFTESL